MISLLWTLLKVGLVVAAAVWLAQRPGDVELRLGDVVVEAPVGAPLVALLFAVLLAAFGYRFWLALRRAPQAMRFGRVGRRRERGYRALSLGMVAVAAGAADEAKRRAREADRLLDGAPLTLLLAAQAAQLDGDDSAARKFFEAMVDEPETSLLGLRGLMAQADRAGDRTEALAIAARAQKERPGTPWVLEALFDLRTANDDWDGASAALEALASRKLVRGEDLRRRRAVVAAERSRLAETRGDKTAALQHARAAWKLDPALPAAAACAARLEGGAGHNGRAEKILRDGWMKAPHPILGEALEALWSGLAPTVRFTQGQRLLKGAAARPETRALLADLALAAGQQAEARKLVEPLVGENAPARLCRQMASIALADGDMEGARMWLARARLAPGDQAWFCRACGAMSAAWHGACPECKVFDSLEWRLPDPPAPGQAAAIAAIEQELATEDAALVAAPARTDAAREA
ncbi:MAG: heme biosynthesis protein HemY [Alphaproteobacteria bacterium]|nr:heme biosynthesis protein HemY [Alphaproteobacteria bacterium]